MEVSGQYSNVQICNVTIISCVCCTQLLTQEVALTMKYDSKRDMSVVL